MAFVEVQFPVGISYGSTGGPEFSTDVLELGSGFEQRNVNWALGRHRYNVAHGVRTRTDIDTIRAFFYARQGRAHGFRYKDWADYSGTDEATDPTVGDTIETDFQICKNYASGGITYVREIKKPVAGSVTVELDGVPQGAGWTVDTTTGIITFAAAPGAGVVVTASFQFDVPVRFDSDFLPVSLQTSDLDNLEDIPIVEVKQ